MSIHESITQAEQSVGTDGMVPVCWPVSYVSLGNRHVLGQGTIFGVTASRFHVTGTIPVEVGMRLHLWGGSPEKPAPFDIRATVVWVNGYGVGLDFHSLGMEGQQWLTGFLAEAHSQSLLRKAA